jgi:hypothetical protein
MISRDEVEKALPANLKSSVTQHLTDMINTLTTDPLLAEEIRGNFITYANVLQEGKWSAEQYVNAVQYVTHKLMGRSNLEAYQLTFPQRYTELVAKGSTSKDISSYVAAYHKGKLVNGIMEKCLIPVHVQFVDVYHAAIAKQAFLMQNAVSEKVQTEAANSLLTHLSKPKDNAPTVAIQVNTNGELNAMKDMMAQLAGAQLNAIAHGTSAKDLAGQTLITIEHENDQHVSTG